MHDLRHAPAPKRLPGGRRHWAVPIDIGSLAAKLTFDGAKQQVHGDATLDFHHGVEAGYPIFDLRQPITAGWLDKVPLKPGAIPLHRFGVKAEQSLRWVEKTLRPGDRHRLRLSYDLAAPPIKGSAKGGYLPDLNWGEGGRVNFNFGFTDLGGGRYLEAWAPANLIYDRFSLRLDVQIRHCLTPHALITNGEVEELERNHWRVRYPASFTSLSPMLQLHPVDAVESSTSQVQLPVSSRTINLEAWKFRANPLDLAGQLKNIALWMARNESAIGPYHHPDRFVAFMHQGGMEYDGACTSAPDALEHEVFHSWWARGLKPASQNDGWIDEAWTVYHDDGGRVEKPFDFKEPPVRLCSGSPWNRATPIESYRLGSRFFAGVAARLGVERLQQIMREFYRLRAPGLITTAQLEAHILDRTNDDVIHRAFARWVYGRS